MKRIILSLTILLGGLNLSAGRFPDSGKHVNIKLDALDFSRYPKIDLYFTLNDNFNSRFSLDEVKNSIKEIRHNGNSFPVKKLESMLNLKRKGESELYISLLFDNSTSMIGRNTLLEKGAELFIDKIKKGDYVNIIDFGSEKNYLSNLIPEFGEELHARERINFSNSIYFLKPKIKTVDFTVRTYFYDALMLALSRLNSTTVLGKKVIIAFTDGKDIGSNANFEDVLKLAQLYSIPIYALDLNNRQNNKLKTLAEKTGGVYYFVKKPEDLIPLYSNLAKLLQNQFRATYLANSDIINSNIHNVSLTLNGSLRSKATKVFVIDGQQVGFYNIVYLENIGKENVNTYLNYLLAFPHSKYFEQAELHLGNFWKEHGEYAKANVVYNNILRNKNLTIYYNALAEKADLLTKAKDYEGSREAYNEIIKSKVTSAIKPKALFDLASTFHAEGNYVSALETYSSLVQNYEGTEWASEGLLKSSIINIQLGDLDKAAKKLKTIVSRYSNTRSAAFAKFELAKILEKKGKIPEALKFYKEIANSQADESLKMQSSLKLAKLLIAQGNYNNAATILKSLIKNRSELPGLQEAVPLYLKALALLGNSFAVAKEFYSLPEEAQTSILKSQKKFVMETPEGKNIILPNGAGIMGVKSSDIKFFKESEFNKKFAVVGPVYNVEIKDDTVATLEIPINKRWFKNKNQFKKAALYYYDRKNFRKISNLTEQDSVIKEVKVNKSGIYSILTKKPIIIRLFNIYFDLAKATIRKEAQKYLFKLIDYLKNNPEIKIEIGGHTDSTGTEEFNYKLSLKRAEAIKNFMVQRGVAPERIIARGYGSQFPIAPNTNEKNRQLNRRTEFVVLLGKNSFESNKNNINRYVLVIKTFSSVKDAYNLKQFFKKRGFNASVLINSSRKGENYQVVLGIFKNRDSANKEKNIFESKFKNYNLFVKKL